MIGLLKPHLVRYLCHPGQVCPSQTCSGYANTKIVPPILNIEGGGKVRMADYIPMAAKLLKVVFRHILPGVDQIALAEIGNFNPPIITCSGRGFLKYFYISEILAQTTFIRNMIKIKSVSGKDNTQYSIILEEYFKLITPEEFYKWQNYIFDSKLSLKKRERHYEFIKSDIKALQKLYKKKTIELNKIAQEKGYNNYLEWRIDLDKIPLEKIDALLNQNVAKFVSLVMKDNIPMGILKDRNKIWNIFNTPIPLGLQIPKIDFAIPDEVISLISKYDPRIKKYKDKINIKLDTKESRSSALFNKEKETVEIQVRKTPRQDIDKVLAFVHELGHALDQLDKYKQGKNPHKLSKYEQEVEANKFMHKFIKTNISEQHQKVLRYNTLLGLSSTLFEINTFRDDQQDYAKAYAKAVRRCYPPTDQKSNPFYVLHNRLITSPLGELMSSIIEVSLYLREPTKKSSN